jgi:hypothetical protein
MLRQIQTLVGTMMWSLVLLAVVLVIALPDDDRFAAPPLWLLAAQFGAGAVILVVLDHIGYRTAAIHVETDQQSAATQAVSAFQAGTILRFSLSELVAIGSLAAAFALDHGSVIGYATGAVVSLALIGFHAWPWSRPVDRTVASLERAGGRSHLREKLGLPPKLGGAIQEL